MIKSNSSAKISPQSPSLPIAEGLKKQAKGFIKQLGSDFYEDLLRPLPGDIESQLIGFPKREGIKPSDGWPRSEQVLFDGSKARQEQEFRVREETSKRQIDQLLSQLRELRQKKEFELRIDIEREKTEIGQLSERLQEKTTINIESNPQGGVQRLIFLQKIKVYLLNKLKRNKEETTTTPQSKRKKGLAGIITGDQKKATETGAFNLFQG